MRVFSLVFIALLSSSATQAEKYIADCKTPGAACPDTVLEAITAAGGTDIESFELAGIATFEADTRIRIANAMIMKDLEAMNVPSYSEGDPIAVDEPTRRRLGAKRKLEDDRFFPLQWYHQAVGSVAAWEKGYRGQGVRVAVLDGGIDTDHPDIKPNLNLELSKSFVPFETIEYTGASFASHASHVASIIGAADNGYGTIGIAPDIELVAVKVHTDVTGSGPWSWLLQGIYYAVSLEVDVINMSLGAKIPKTQGPSGPDSLSAADIAQMKVAVCGAVTYAYQKGVTVIVAAGNDGLNMKGSTGAQFVDLLGDCKNAIAISAAGPQGWALDPSNADADWYTKASYSTNGQIDFAGPGGSYDYPGTQEYCNVIGIVRPCYLFDFSFGVGRGTWYWSVGTSMAAPGAAGVAALIISENNGEKMHPAQVKSEMKKRALALGKKGHDNFYGFGHVHSGH